MRTYIFCWIFLCILLYSGSLIRTVTSKSDTEDQTDTSSKHTENALACSPCSCVYCIIIGTAGGLAFGFVLVGGAFIFWKCKKSTIMQCIFSAKKNDGQLKTALLQRQAEKTHEELDVLSALNTLMKELKRGYHQQKEEFKQLEETNKELAENKEKLCLVENEIAKSEKEKETDKTERYLEEKQSLLNVQRKLEKRKEDLENLQLNMEKQLQQTEDIMSMMTERKTKVERTLEVINSQLEEVESQSDTAHLHTQ
ncbi:dynein regulatory complex subunit 4-like isoform X2 [Astatotilapia calliptera]|nr:dynein regulatory complex subunit 4-like isoform X2 [Astatotilapia calliptera]